MEVVVDEDADGDVDPDVDNVNTEIDVPRDSMLLMPPATGITRNPANHIMPLDERSLSFGLHSHSARCMQQSKGFPVGPCHGPLWALFCIWYIYIYDGIYFGPNSGPILGGP